MIVTGMDLKSLNRNYSLIKYNLDNLENKSPNEIIHSNVFLGKYPYKIDYLSKTSNNKKYYRVKNFSAIQGQSPEILNPKSRIIVTTTPMRSTSSSTMRVTVFELKTMELWKGAPLAKSTGIKK
jgi:hypothetical protein